MARKLDEATKDYYKRKSKWEMTGFVMQFIGISVLLTGIMTKLSVLINWGTLITGTGLILLVAGKLMHQEILKK